MGMGQKFSTRVGSNFFARVRLGRVSNLWFGFGIGKFTLKYQIFQFYALWVPKKIFLGWVKKYPGQRRVGLFFTSGRVGSGPIYTCIKQGIFYYMVLEVYFLSQFSFWVKLEISWVSSFDRILVDIKKRNIWSCYPHCIIYSLFFIPWIILIEDEHHLDLDDEKTNLKFIRSRSLKNFASIISLCSVNFDRICNKGRKFLRIEN